MLSLVPADTEPPAIVRTVATRDEGTRALAEAVLAFHARARDSGRSSPSGARSSRGSSTTRCGGG